MPEPKVSETDIKGLFVIDLVVHEDTRGSFREAFRAEKLEALGLPRLGPVQWNIAENLRPGIVRGIHAEPWEKFVHVVHGRVFAAIADLRPKSATFKQVKTFDLDRSKALFLSRGLGNSCQVLEAGTIYGYLVNGNWQPGQQYLGIRYNDPELNIRWPLPVGPEDLSEKDWGLPTLRRTFSESP
ncbi:MAG: dTDP-4-dehydrorhamnose 3,5-epimerase family protein [Candidatus Kerfeldbacteria bacterium]|nr:dTDP-4-dehydrorhamnose 3,5-epimerase family protein [Candidatus Kerfeldbacteria bacterium]